MLEIIFASTPLFIGGVAVFGLLVGSFLNVVILRLPARLEFEWRSQAREILELGTGDAEREPPDLVFKRSMCPQCGHQITALENLPLISYLVLRGRCSSCKHAISIRYPLVEAITALLFVAVALHFGPTWQCAAGLLITGFLVAMTGIDIDHQLLPDQLTLPLLWAGLMASLAPVFVTPAEALIGAAVGYLSLWSIYHLFRLVTGKEGMGYGDFKLMAALGAWMGWQALPLVILLSSLVGAITGITLILLKRHQSDQPMPFGPYIAAAGWIALLWGRDLLDMYLRFSGLA